MLCEIFEPSDMGHPHWARLPAGPFELDEGVLLREGSRRRHVRLVDRGGFLFLIRLSARLRRKDIEVSRPRIRDEATLMRVLDGGWARTSVKNSGFTRTSTESSSERC